MPAIGTRVRYERKNASLPQRSCVGTVVAQYPGGYKHTDPETGVEYISPDAVAVKVDEPIPTWWPYDGNDRFAPDVDELEAIEAQGGQPNKRKVGDGQG